MSRKLTYEFVKSEFEKEGCILISNTYINTHTKLGYICAEGHTHSIRYSDFNKGHRCSICAGLTKPKLALIEQIFKQEGYTLLSKEYKNNRTKLYYSCPKGHEHSITWSDFNSGYRCPFCAILKSSGKGNPSWKGGVKQLNLPLYETFAHQLEKYQPVYKIEQDSLVLLGVECKYCTELFVPTMKAVQHRVAATQDLSLGEANLYCSNKCKELCVTYGQHTYTKDNKPYKNAGSNQTVWAVMVKERDNYTCQKCGAQNNIMYAHHIDPIINNPIESADIDNGITYCKSCHTEAHHILGCSLTELRC